MGWRNRRRVGTVAAGMTLGVKASMTLLPFLLIPLLTACGDDEPAAPVELEFTVQAWTGAQREQPAPSTSSVILGEFESFSVPVAGEELLITVVKIDDDKIRLETSRKMAPRGDGGGINLNDTTDEFSLDRADQVEFSTPTTDAGTTVTVAEVS
ncbi:hypothetical protein ACOACQ_09395 [Nocardioides sp. CPCC 206347]|uniref:hypothetical protein n=1 Tax=unclassified Nocardioides TaxID=2615069 RepID=UPI00360D35B3